MRGISLLKRAAKAEPKRSLGFYQAAFERFQIAADRNPGYFQAHLSWGHGLYNLARSQREAPKDQWKNFQSACKQYELAHIAEPKDFDALKFWALSLRGLAQNKREKDPDQCYKLAYEKFEKACLLAEKNHDGYYHWGRTLFQQAKKKDPAQARALLRESCGIFERAAKQQKNRPDIHNDWGVSLLALANLTENETEKQHLLSEAQSKCFDAEKLKAGFASYNLACIASLSGDPDNCRRYLETAREQFKIPSPGHLANDPDFKNVRNTDWFKALTQKVREEF